jgi:hypothetical protein
VFFLEEERKMTMMTQEQQDERFSRTHRPCPFQNSLHTSLPNKIKGLDQKELDKVLDCVYALHHVPFELQDIIWKLSEIEKCTSCELAYPSESFHKCEIYGHSLCRRCMPAHFCVFYTSASPHAIDRLICTVLAQEESVNVYWIGFQADASNEHCAVTLTKIGGILTSESLFDAVHDNLEGLKDRIYEGTVRIEHIPSFEELRCCYLRVYEIEV